LGVPATPAPALCHPAGCERCHGSGYIGRSGIYEVSPIDAPLARMIHDGASDADMETYARSRAPGIRDDGLKRVLGGDTSLEELLRVTRASV
ncbi:general secretory pathway protein E, partial [mine drainage metagenome]